MDQIKKNSYSWMMEHNISPNLIIDPDGWNRADLYKSMMEEITEEEFAERLADSTIKCNEHIDAFFEKVYNDLY